MDRVKLSGYSYVRNGLRLGYPFLESIRSVLPICDEFIMVVGDSTDGTREAVAALGEKVRIIDTIWDDALRQNGKIFALQSNIGLDACQYDWVLPIQADEVIHESGLPKIQAAIEQYDADKKVEGFILPFLHFWGDYQHIRNSRRVHRFETRIVRRSEHIKPFKDSQGFRYFPTAAAYAAGRPNRKLRVKLIDTPIYHYVAVKSEAEMKGKMSAFLQRYESTDMENLAAASADFKFQQVDRVVPFTDSHPAVMAARIADYTYTFEYDPSKATWKGKDRFIQPIEDFLGVRFGEFKNYKLI